MLALSAATEMMWHGIRVNAIEPGWTDTPGERTWYPAAARSFLIAFASPASAQLTNRPLARLTAHPVAPRHKHSAYLTAARSCGTMLRRKPRVGS